MHLSGRRDTGRGSSRRAMATLGGLFLLLVTPAVAAAHAEFVASTPTDGEIVGVAPPEVVLVFSEPVSASSSFEVLDSSGARITAGGPDPADPTRMRAVLPVLASSSYEVRWTAITDDGHIERGTFRFTVLAPTPPPPTPTVEPSEATAAPATPSTTPTAIPASSPAPSGGDSSGQGVGTDVLLPILAVAVLVGAGLVLVLRRRNLG